MNYTTDKTQKHPYLDGMYRLYKDWVGIGWVGENAEIGEGTEIGEKAGIGEGAQIREDVVIGEKAWIGENAWIGEGTRIGEGAWIGKGARIGAGAVIGAGAMIYDGATIYENAVIGACARIGAGAVIKYPYDYLTVGAIGSRQDVTTFYRHKDGMIYVWCGCFNGTLDEFEAAVRENHAGNEHEKAYMAAIRMAKETMIHD